MNSSQSLLFAVFLTLSASAALGKSRSLDDGENHVDPEMCSRLVERIFYSHVTVPTPPDNEGEWTSERCEVRPGPEYVLRKYRFETTLRFSAHIFYYADADCSNPLYLIRAAGTYSLLLESWTVPGGTEVDYELQEVSVMMYTTETARHLGARINATCPGLHLSWEPYKHYVIFAFAGGAENEEREYDGMAGEVPDDPEHGIVMDNDCTSSLYFSFHELQLMRLEERHHHRQNAPVRMLYLGDIHTDRKQRQTYRPTSYQPPLLPAQQAGCTVCTALINADDYYPPSLKRTRSPKVALPGEWFSERCETRPNGMFLTRRLLFNDDNKSWEGSYYHYRDALCREPTFTIYALGTYSPGALSSDVGRSYNFDFKVNQAKITPGDEQIVTQLNKGGMKCGANGVWRIGQEVDVTDTNGCDSLGIRVPHVEYEILRFEKEHHKTLLFLGQRPSDGGHPSTPQKRPTSFQAPLVKCAKPLSVTPPTVRKYNSQLTSGATRRASSLFLLPSAMLTLLTSWLFSGA